MSKFSTSVMIVFLGTLLAKSLGFLRDIILTYHYGASSISDIYIVATTIPTVLFSGIGMALLTSFIPIYSRMENDSIGKRRAFVSNIISLIFVLALFLIGVYFLFPDLIIKTFAMGFDESTIQKTIPITNFSIFSVLFIGVWYIMQGLLQVNNRFAFTGFSSLPLNLCIIIGIIISVKSNLTAMGIGFVSGYFLASVWGYLAVRKDGYKYIPNINLKDPNLKALMIMILPVFFSQMIMQINVVINTTLASTLAPGIVSCLSYASRINDLLATLIITTIGTVVFPAISKMAADNDYRKVADIFDFSVQKMLLFIFPATIGLISLSEPVIHLLFGRGAFTSENVQITSIALICYVIAMPFYCYNYMASKVFFSMKNTTTPMFNSVIAVVINICLSFILIKWLGYRGLAIAATSSVAISSLLMSLSLKRRNKNISFKNNICIAFQIFIVAMLMGIIVFYIFNIFSLILSDVVSLALSIIIGIIIYFTILYLFNISSMKVTIQSNINLIMLALRKR